MPNSLPAVTADDYRAAMRCVPAAVSVVTVGGAGDRNGLTVSSVCSLSIAPPTLLVCVHTKASALSAILETGAFAVNVLALGQEAIAEAFSGASGLRGEARFHEGHWYKGLTGMPVLSGTVCSFECEVSEHQRVATHVVLFGKVVRSLASPDAAPLLYQDGNFRALTMESEDAQ